MENRKIAEVFDQMAELLEFRGENPFRIRAYQNGARAVREFDQPLAKLAADADVDLARLHGIGKTLAEKIHVLVDTGTLPQLEELRAEVPAVAIQMARIPGLGAKKAVRLIDELGITTLDDLAAACREDHVAGLKGFGKKSQAVIFEGIALAQTASQRLKWVAAESITLAIDGHMAAGPPIDRSEWAGSFRRGRETVGDLDLLAVAADREAVMDHFAKFPGHQKTIARGGTKMSILVAAGSAMPQGFQVDLRLVEADQFGAALQYFTGSQAHNIRVRRKATEAGLKINEYGVFRLDDETVVAGQDERSVYQAVGMPWIPPALREDRHEFDDDAARRIEQLVQLKDIRGDLHMHTTASDGQNSLREMANAAISRGLNYIAITDHSKRVSMAGGLDAGRLLAQWKEIDEIRKEYEGRLVILKGIECDILEAGGMDLPDDVLAQGDWVLASVHYGQKQPRDQITERILGAVENPHVDCIAHPTGRLINRRESYEVDLDAVMDAAAASGTMLELNANPARLDLDDVHVAAASGRGIPIVINTDAHHRDGLAVMVHGIRQAQRGGLRAVDVANAADTFWGFS